MIHSLIEYSIELSEAIQHGVRFLNQSVNVHSVMDLLTAITQEQNTLMETTSTILVLFYRLNCVQRKDNTLHLHSSDITSIIGTILLYLKLCIEYKERQITTADATTRYIRYCKKYYDILDTYVGATVVFVMGAARSYINGRLSLPKIHILDTAGDVLVNNKPISVFSIQHNYEQSMLRCKTLLNQVFLNTAVPDIDLSTIHDDSSAKSILHSMQTSDNARYMKYACHLLKLVEVPGLHRHRFKTYEMGDVRSE